MRIEKVLNKRYFKVNYRTFSGTVFVFLAGRYQVGIIKKKFPNKTHTKSLCFQGFRRYKVFKVLFLGTKITDTQMFWLYVCSEDDTICFVERVSLRRSEPVPVGAGAGFFIAFYLTGALNIAEYFLL